MIGTSQHLKDRGFFMSEVYSLHGGNSWRAVPSPEGRWHSRPLIARSADPVDRLVQSAVWASGLPMGSLPMYHFVRPLSIKSDRDNWECLQSDLSFLITQKGMLL